MNPPPTPKKPITASKVENDPKIKSKSKVWIEENIDNQSCSTTWSDPKTALNPNLTAKIARCDPQKNKMTKKLSQNWKYQRKWKMFNYQNRPFGLQKAQNKK